MFVHPFHHEDKDENFQVIKDNDHVVVQVVNHVQEHMTMFEILSI
jgi:hypothetical protein